MTEDELFKELTKHVAKLLEIKQYCTNIKYTNKNEETNKIIDYILKIIG